MTLPGIRVQTYAGLVGEGHLNQVFFTDVEVPASMRMGEEGHAWSIITYALRFERVSVARFHVGRKVLDRSVQQLIREGRFNDTAVRVRAGRIATMLEVGRWLSYFVIDQRVKQGADDVNGNIARVSVSEATRELQNFIMDYTPDALLGGDQVLLEFFRSNLSSTIAAGAYEIQLNLISQGALNLPRSN
jgi:alkylation response protein AidB-like acyl-CoA dehydrogenase